MGFLDKAKDLGLGGGNLGRVLLVVVVIIVIAAATIAFTWWLASRKKYNLKIKVLKKVGKQVEEVGFFRGGILRLGDGGDTVLYIPKLKKWLPTPELQTGRNVYWFFIRQDQEWINVSLADIDEEMREVGANFLDKEMRYARTSLQSKIKDRYNKPGFWEKYGGVVAYTVLILITSVGLFLVIDKLVQVNGATAGALDSATAVLEETKRILGILDNIKGGSGLTPALFGWLF